MKTKKYILSLLVVLITGFISGVFLLQNAKAAGGNFHVFSAGSGSVAVGANISVPVYINTGGQLVDSIDMTFTYDSSKLEFQSASASGSPFNQSPIYNNTGNSIVGGAYTTTAVSGDKLVFTAVFKAKVGSGSATVQVAAGSAAYGSGNSIGAALGSGTISFTTPVCPAGYTGTYPNCVAPTSGGGTGGNTGGSTGGNTGTGNTGGSNGTGNTGNSNGNSKPATNNNGTSQTPTSPTTTTPTTETTTAPGVIPELSIGIYDKNHKPLKQKKVTLHSEPQTVTTDDKGIAKFKNVPVGDHTLVYTDAGKEYSQPLTLASDLIANAGSNGVPTTNATAVVFPIEQKSNTGLLVATSAGLALILALAGGWFLIKRRPWSRNDSHVHEPASTAAITVDTPVQKDETGSLLDRIHGVPTPQPGSTYAPRNDNEDKE